MSSREKLSLRLAGLAPGHTRQEGELHFVVRDAADEDEPYDVQVACDVDNLGSRIHVRAEVAGTATSTCHRCLRTFERGLQTTFDVTLQSGSGAGEEDPEGELVGVSESAVEFDLEPYVREAVLLEEPIQLVCSEGCQGLCPRCGADRNRGPCGCVPAADPRWEPLQNLKRLS